MRARFARAAARARAAGKPIALVKAGRTEAAARTVRTHTGALAGADGAFDAFCRQAGIARCDTLATLCETLKIFHAGGPLRGRRVLVMGASGGDMAMTADAARNLSLDFAPVAAGTAPRGCARFSPSGSHRQPVRFPHAHLVRPARASARCSRWCCAPASTRSASCSTARRRRGG